MQLLKEQIEAIIAAQAQIKEMESFRNRKWNQRANLSKKRGDNGDWMEVQLNESEQEQVDDLIACFIGAREAAIEPLIDKLVKVESLIYPQENQS